MICEYLDEAYPDTPLLGTTLGERVEVRRLVAWFDGKFAAEVTQNLNGQKYIKRLAGRGHPDATALRAGYAALREHLPYLGWLAETRKWLAGGAISLADFAAAAHLSVLDFTGDVDWSVQPAGAGMVCADEVAAQRSGRCCPTGCPAWHPPRITPTWISRRPVDDAMDDADIGYLAASELAALYRAKELSPVEVVDGGAAPDRAARAGGQRNDAHDAGPRARGGAAVGGGVRAAARRPGCWKAFRSPSRTCSTPRACRRILAPPSCEGTIPDVDAPCVTRLLDAGGMMIGKTTSAAELGWKGVSQARCPASRTIPGARAECRRAPPPARGAAAACGYGPLHQGGDGGGSIRMPAHFCGVYGIKPTHGRVPNWPMSNNDLATHIGPLTRTVADAALMLQAMAGPHAWDYTSLEAPPQDYAAQLRAARWRASGSRYSPRSGPRAGRPGRGGAGGAGGGRVRGDGRRSSSR